MATYSTVVINVPIGFQLSQFVKTLQPNDGKLLIEYGEHMLNEHHRAIKETIDDDRIRELHTLIKTSKLDIDKLTNTIDQQLIDHETTVKNIKRNHDILINNISSEINTKHSNDIILINNSLSLERDKYNDTKRHYENTLSNIRQEHMDDIASKLFNERAVWRSQLDIMTASIEQTKLSTRAEVSQRYADQITQLNDQINTMRVDIDNMRQSHDKALLEQRDALLTKLDPITKLYSSSSIEKGQSGEALIRNILSQVYPSCVLTDVSQTDHTCDILFKLDDLKINALIEVKNKASLRMDDITKFHNDLMNQSDNINCALFISINTPNIPTKGSFSVEYRGGKPIIYMHMQSGDMIKHAIQMLGLLLNHIESTSSTTSDESHHTDDVIELINDIYSTIKAGCSKIHKIKISISQLSRLANDASVSIGKSIDSMISFYTKYDKFKRPDIDVSHTTTYDVKYSDAQMDKLILYVKEKQQIPTRDVISDMLNISEVSVRKLGGVRDLKKILKQYINAEPPPPSSI